ncbi:MAG TPA: hypothetical protein VFV07_12090 [Rhizomicrobium sp.]|nr:hypothetical protein [Rhizomicrobium sp.]
MKRRTVLKGLGWTAFAAAVLVGLALGGLRLMFLHFYPAPPAKDYPRPASALEAQRQDVDYFRKLVALDFSFSPAARAEANKELDALAASPAVLSRPKFRVALMRVAALADNGHTTTSSDPDAWPLYLPVRVAEFSDGFYVMSAKSEDAALLGGRVVAVDGHPIDDVMRNLEAVRGGAPQFRRYYAGVFLEMQDVLFGLGIAPDANHSTWTVVTPDGRQVSQTLAAYKRAAHEPFPFPERWFSNEPLKGQDKSWASYDPGVKLPRSLAQFDTPFRRFRLDDGCTLVIQLKSNTDEDGAKIADFLAATDKEMDASKPCNIILDNRLNGGGDYTKTYDFAHALPDKLRPGGHIYLLTGAATFSAGITTTTFVKQAGGEHVRLLGEEVGDRLAFFAEGVRGCMPNYHMCMYYQRGKHDYRHPCRYVETCYWLNWYYAPRVKTLDPDETITMSFADWKAGRDPVFDRAVQLATGKP